MSQAISIILKIDEHETDGFERIFEQEVVPLWQEFHAEGRLLGASLTPVEGGDFPSPAGSRCCILHVEMPGMAKHNALDGDARFVEFLSRARAFQPAEPLVWFGTTLHSVP